MYLLDLHTMNVMRYKISFEAEYDWFELRVFFLLHWWPYQS